MMVDFATGRRLNPGERMLFAASARDEELAVRFDAFGSRRIGPARMFATTVPRALLVNARHALRGDRTANGAAAAPPPATEAAAERERVAA